MNSEEEYEKYEKVLEADELELFPNGEKSNPKSEPESLIERAPNEGDLEKGVSFGKGDDVTAEGLRDPFLVVWDGPNDPENPKNWKFSRKWAAVGIISAFTFMTPVSSSMIAPAVPAMSKELGIRTEIVAEMSLSIFILAYAVGPLFLGPLSEVYGRARVMQWANLFYLVWNFACGWAYTIPEIMAFRFLAGLGGSAPLTIGGGVMGDLFHAEDRGKAIALFTMGPLLGPAVGPIAGGWIAEKTTWRWVFWSCTILTVIIQGLGLLYLQETFAPVLLQRRAATLRKRTGNNSYYTEWDSPDRTAIQIIHRALKRPFRFLMTEPIIQAIALYMAYLYGMLYLMLSSFPSLWANVYHESVGIGSLNYIALGLGLGGAVQTTAPLQDRIYRKLKARNGGVGRPEFRVPLMFVSACICPIGLFWYGWSAQAKLHWIMPNIGAAMFCGSAIVGFTCMQAYIVDSYTLYAASGIAAAVILRSLAGFGFPLFAPYMVKSLGYGWSMTVLAIVAIVLGIPAPLLFWFYGQKLRAKSKFAARQAAAHR